MSKTFERPSRLLVHALLSLAVVGIGGITGCSSPLTSSGRSEAEVDANAVVARTLAEASARGELHEPTVAQEVRELTLADSAGPVTNSDNAITPVDASAVPAATAPAAAAPAVPAAATPATAPVAEPMTATSIEAATAPSTAPATAPGVAAATQPATQPDEQDAALMGPNQIGLDESRLHQKEPIFNLSLEDCIARACRNNLAIKVESFNPAIKESEIIQAEAAFDPIIFGYLNWAETDEPNNSVVPTGTNGHQVQHQFGIKQLLPSGATAQVSASQNYKDIFKDDPNNVFPGGTPSLIHTRSWTDNLNATITQPLARGFGTAVNEADIYLAQRDTRIARATFRRQVISSVSDTETAYHNLVLARTLVDIQQRLLDATELTYIRVKARQFIDADKIAVNQAIAAVEARRAELIRARANLRTQSDILKGLLNDPEIDLRSNVLINPTDRPTAELVITSTADAIQTALQQRTEMEEARLSIEKTDIIIRVAKNDLLPKVDLTVGVQTNSLDTNFLNAFASTFTSQFIDYNAGIRIEIPIGNRKAEEELVQHKHERAQALVQMRAAAEKVVQDVKQQLRDMLTFHAEIQARERARISAAEELLAISQKENIVALSPEFLQLKLDSQNRLAAAEQALIQALVNYNIAIMKFEQSKGTLLEYDHISLDRFPLTRYQDDAGKLRFMGQTYMLR